MADAANTFFVALIRRGDFRPELRTLGQGDESEKKCCRVGRHRRRHDFLLL